MFITTTFNIEGYRITEYKGMVRGITVRVPRSLKELSVDSKTSSGDALALTLKCASSGASRRMIP